MSGKSVPPPLPARNQSDVLDCAARLLEVIRQRSEIQKQQNDVTREITRLMKWQTAPEITLGLPQVKICCDLMKSLDRQMETAGIDLERCEAQLVDAGRRIADHLKEPGLATIINTITEAWSMIQLKTQAAKDAETSLREHASRLKKLGKWENENDAGAAEKVEAVRHEPRLMDQYDGQLSCLEKKYATLVRELDQHMEDYVAKGQKAEAYAESKKHRAS